MNGHREGQITYRELMERQARIRVPMLQRDYAQGRSDQAEVREEFLAALEQALNRPIGDPELPLNLDFIYGSVEGPVDAPRFAPLDGQQRLTTLFLLHWFLAWQDDEWEQFIQMFRGADGSSRFTYRVRQSSSEFFDKLVSFRPAVHPSEIPSIASHITDQAWYFRSWRLDQTVQSALTMLGAIQQRFQGSKNRFARLTDAQHPAITFQLLLLENFGLSDDLYIKMNARGKPLTAFENFKAQYEHSLSDQFAKQTRRVNERDYPVAKFVALRMDTTWADFLWPHRDQATNLCDGLMMNLFRVLALVTRDTESSDYSQDVVLLRYEDSPPSYSAFHLRGWLHEEFTEVVIALLEAWSARSKDKNRFEPLLPNTRYFNEVLVFEKIRRHSVSLTLTEVTQFAAYVLFIRHHSDAIATPSFQEWMRVVRNLAANTPVERSDQLRNAAQGLRELLPHARDILGHLSRQPVGTRVQGFYQPQVLEEQTKAGLLLRHDGWRPLIDRAEQHGYFVGQIDFLCEFSGASARRKAAPDFNWGVVAHSEFQRQFEFYLTKAEAMFSANGLNDDDQHRWQRALLVMGDYLLPAGSNHSLLIDASTDPASWKRFLRTGAHDTAAENVNRPFLKQLWSRLQEGGSLHAELDAIITNASGLPAWRESLVRTPAAITYCGKRAIRRLADGNAMLLSKSTMGSSHVELFTYCLYLELLIAENRQRISPLDVWGYNSTNDSYTLPRLQLSFNSNKRTTIFSIKHEGGVFAIQFVASSLESLPELKCLLTDRAGFASMGEDGYWLSKNTPRADILDTLEQLGKLLAPLQTKPSPS